MFSGYLLEPFTLNNLVKRIILRSLHNIVRRTLICHPYLWAFILICFAQSLFATHIAAKAEAVPVIQIHCAALSMCMHTYIMIYLFAFVEEKPLKHRPTQNQHKMLKSLSPIVWHFGDPGTEQNRETNVIADQLHYHKDEVYLSGLIFTITQCSASHSTLYLQWHDVLTRY